jgi:hypothetical protein
VKKLEVRLRQRDMELEETMESLLSTRKELRESKERHDVFLVTERRLKQLESEMEDLMED